MGKIHPIGRITTPRSALIGIKRTRRWKLTTAPLVSAAIATSATVATAATTITAATAAVASATAAVTAATPAVAAAASTAATPRRTRFTRTRFVNGQGPAFDGLAIELGDCL